ncbi:DUF6596 domain-containing protein [Hymenobacter sp.]|uniref:RNA polymerase sigma factor n=1 Tax=Hymenobacter sp. TaxID=1898978 RepID=UPI00286A0B0A|nr:DUF6596 domain-containing protein [Hymenobacter sp.]
MTPADKALKELFQAEFTKMVAVIGRYFGLQHLEAAEDVVGETFLLATQTWTTTGLPPNPAAWLYAVAKQKSLLLLRREKLYEQKILPELAARQDRQQASFELNFSPQSIRDSQLQMLFAICTPAIASEAQMGLALRILCGFGIEEIAEAFFSTKEAINKRLFRAREKLRAAHISLELPDDANIARRLDSVLHVLYLLFSEGYYSKTQNQILRQDLCREALRLGLLLTEYAPTNQPKTNALLALMCFHASRFGARLAGGAAPVLYEQQDEALWDHELIQQGTRFLLRSAEGTAVSSYHLEARIACWHCQKADTAEKWEEILQLYNQLLLLNYSPSVALNRTFALYKANGAAVALVEAEKLRLEDNHFYFLLLGELYQEMASPRALPSFERAYALAKTPAEKAGIQQRIDSLTHPQ